MEITAEGPAIYALPPPLALQLLLEAPMNPQGRLFKTPHL